MATQTETSKAINLVYKRIFLFCYFFYSKRMKSLIVQSETFEIEICHSKTTNRNYDSPPDRALDIFTTFIHAPHSPRLVLTFWFEVRVAAQPIASATCKQTILLHHDKVNLNWNRWVSAISLSKPHFSWWIFSFSFFWTAKCHRQQSAQCQANGKVIYSVPTYPIRNTISACCRWINRCSFTSDPAKRKHSTNWPWPYHLPIKLAQQYWAHKLEVIRKKWLSNLPNDWRNKYSSVAMCRRITPFVRCWSNVWPMKSNDTQKHFECFSSVFAK